jgi:hypothetical protein
VKIVEFPHDLAVNGSAHKAGARYVTSDSVAMCLGKFGVRVIADARPWLRHWKGEPLEGKTLLIHAAMGVGDEFIAARLAKVAKEILKAASVRLHIFEYHHSFWAHDAAGLPFILGTELVPFDEWKLADFHVTHEGWWESFSAAMPDQPDVWDCIGQACGISIAPHLRKPYIPTVKDEDYKAMIEAYWKHDRLAVWVLGASSRIRSYHPHQTVKAIKELVAKDYRVLAIGYPEQVTEYGVKGIVGVSILSDGVPQMLAAIKLAADHPRAVLVTPDSAAGHAAACYPRLPVISLWSSFDPAKRITGYTNHVPIFQQIRCSPCFAHEYYRDGEQSKTGCPLTSCNGFCHGLEAIKPDLIVEQVIKASEGRKV